MVSHPIYWRVLQKNHPQKLLLSCSWNCHQDSWKGIAGLDLWKNSCRSNSLLAHRFFRLCIQTVERGIFELVLGFWRLYLHNDLGSDWRVQKERGRENVNRIDHTSRQSMEMRETYLPSCNFLQSGGYILLHKKWV